MQLFRSHRAAAWSFAGAYALILCVAQAGTDLARITGHWEGAIDVPTGKLAIDIDLADREGALAGDISIPVQMVRDMALGDMRIELPEVHWTIPEIPGTPTFNGKLSEDGNTIAGEFSQGGATLTFSLTRSADPSAKAGDALAGFDEFIDQAREAWKVPGVAVGIVRDGKVVSARGYGMRDVDGAKPVTERTLFAIGSSTKAFTTFVMAQLADEGKLDWSHPVREYIPEFRMYDDVAGERMTPRDLVTHRSGLPRHDLLWYNSTITLESMVHRLPYLENSKDFRTDFQYNNLMFGTAGHLIERISGKSWEDNVRERVFERLGMSRSNFSVLESQRSDDFALPYEERDDVVRRMEFRDITNVGPAGAINSSLEDMLKWATVHSHDGKLGDVQTISPTSLELLHAPAMPLPIDPTQPNRIAVGYALGWFVEVFRGHLLIHHGGNIDGFSALVAFFPRERIGMVVLVNKNASPLPGLIVRHAADRLLGLEPIDWSGEALAKAEQAKSAQKEASEKKHLARRPDTSPSRALAEYVGEYEHSGYGTLAIGMENDHLNMTFNRITAPLEHWHFDVFNCMKVDGDNTFEDTKLMFVAGMEGDIDAVEAPFELATKNIVFTRRPDENLTDPKYLEKFLGSYELAPQVLKISLRGRELVADVVGQPTYVLEPTRNDTFNLKGISGFRAKFITGADGKASEIQVVQPDGVYVFHRKAD